MQNPPPMFFPKLLRWSYLRNLESYLMRFPNPVSSGLFSKHGGENAEMRCVCWATRMVQSHGASSGTYQNYIYIYLYLFIYFPLVYHQSSLTCHIALIYGIFVWAFQLHRPFLFSPHACLKSERKRNKNNFCAERIIRWQKKEERRHPKREMKTEAKRVVSTLRHNCSDIRDNAKNMTSNTIRTLGWTKALTPLLLGGEAKKLKC